MPIFLKRVYDQPTPQDGIRVLVERLWPRGLTKEKATIHQWLKEVAPSPELRKWFNHDPDKWNEFKEKYFSELRQCEGHLTPLIKHIQQDTVTFVFASKEERFNNAVALKEYLEHMAS